VVIDSSNLYKNKREIQYVIYAKNVPFQNMADPLIYEELVIYRSEIPSYTEEFNESLIEMLLNHLLDNLKVLRFNILLGILVTEEPTQERIMFLHDNGYTIKNCCSCKRKTTTKINCCVNKNKKRLVHVCVECLSKMVVVTQKCPFCKPVYSHYLQVTYNEM
jgi:hypothetical protein